MRKQLTVAAMILAACLTFTGCAGKELPLLSVPEFHSNTETYITEETPQNETKPDITVHETEKVTPLTGSGHYRGLEITVRCSDPRKVDIHFENTSSDGYSLGWVSGPTITCGTTAGEYYYNAGTAMIRAGGMADVTGYFDDAAGEIQYVAISNVNMLTSRGLPSDVGGGDTVYISFSEDAANMTNGSDRTEQVTETPVATVKTGTADLEGLEISVTAHDPRSVTVEYKNNSATEFSLGWVGGLTVTCTTTAGEYYYASNMAIIKSGGSLKENYYFDNAEGELLSITLSGIHFLRNGLPSDFGGGEYITIEMG